MVRTDTRADGDPVMLDPEQRGLVLGLVQALIRPLVRVALRSLIPYQEFSDLVRTEYVRIGHQLTHRVGARENISRIAVVTGLHRRDVKAALKRRPSARTRSMGVIANLLGIWSSSARFLDDQGRPKRLTYRGIDNGFRKLVRRTAVSIDAGAILKELLRLNLVRKDGKELELLASENIFQGKENLPEAYEFLETELQNLLDASLQNLMKAANQESPNAVLRTSFDNIPVEHAAEIQQWLRERAQLEHTEVRKYLALFDRDTQLQSGELEASEGAPKDEWSQAGAHRSTSIEAHFSTVSVTRVKAE